MLIINNKMESKANEYEIKENVVHLSVNKKDGSLAIAKIDTEDLQKVLAKGSWFAEWNKAFNNYLVQNLSDQNIDGKKLTIKQSLHSFILEVSPKAPIIHLNGDTLDNRKANLELYSENKINEYKILDSETAAILLKDRFGRETGKALIDKEDLDRVLNSGYTWVYYKGAGKPAAIANSPEGRIYLSRFIMNTDADSLAEYVNLNTLDNRKANLNNVALNKDEENQ